MKPWQKIVVIGGMVIVAGTAVYYLAESRRIKKINETIVSPVQASDYIKAHAIKN